MQLARTRAAVFFGLGLIAAAPYALAQEAPVTPAEAQDAAIAEVPDFTGIVARVRPAVVAIATRQLVEAEPPPWLFERFGEEFGQDDGMVPREARGIGSGFLISADGHIVTNDHVIADATDIQVQLHDGSSVGAELVGRDPLTDLAVLKIEVPPTLVDELVVPEWGDSDALEPGAWTIAMGSPFGLGDTVTVGVLSARSRDVRAGPYDDFLQTDAAINVGNSGGPLFNIAGEVVGVNTAIISPTGVNVGIGFAVPSRTASRVVAELIETGEVRRGFLGVSLQDMTDVMARAFGLPADTRGALVGNIEPGSPAEAAGLEPGDVVVALQGEPIEASRELSFMAAELTPGEPATLTILRDGEEREVELTVAQRETPRAERPVDVDEPDRSRLGLLLRPVPGELREEIELEEGGVVIERVVPGGLGASVGLRQGDVIVEVDRSRVTEPADVAEAWASAREEERPLLMRIRRGDAALFVAVEG